MTFNLRLYLKEFYFLKLVFFVYLSFFFILSYPGIMSQVMDATGSLGLVQSFFSLFFLIFLDLELIIIILDFFF